MCVGRNVGREARRWEEGLLEKVEGAERKDDRRYDGGEEGAGGRGGEAGRGAGGRVEREMQKGEGAGGAGRFSTTEERRV